MFIYLMQSDSTGYTKIGVSKDAHRRVKDLKWHVPDIRLVDSVQAHPVWEKELHLKYEKFRVFGEWFNLNEVHLREIAALFEKKRESDRTWHKFEAQSDSV
jgi:hypothetical protein